jgi:hypothetical protein
LPREHAPPASAPAAPGKLVAFADACQRLTPGAVVVVAATFALRRLDDFDTFWHLAAGRWIVSHHTVPWTDTLSYTVPHRPWIDVQWLYDAALYGLYQLGGANALVLAAALAFTAAIWLLVRNVRRFVSAVPTAVLVLVAIVVSEERFLIRPEMISFVLLEIVLGLLLGARSNAGRRLWLLVPLMLIWVNCHSLFIIGLFVIACAAVAPQVARLPLLPVGWRVRSQFDPVTRRRLLVAATAAAAVTLVNPYGLTGVLFPFKLLSRINGSNPLFQMIGEFRPPFSPYFLTTAVATYRVFFVTSVILVSVAALLSLGRPRERPAEPGLDLAGLGIFAGLAYVSVMARRNIGLFALGASPFVAAAAAALAARSPAALRRWTGLAARLLAPVVLVICGVGVLAVASNGYYLWNGETCEFGLGVLEVNFPIRAAAFCRAMSLPPKLYNDLTAGGYLSWDAAVDGGVFVDGRLEVYGADFLASYNWGLANAEAWEREADRFGVNTVVLFHRWSNRHALIAWLANDPRWTLVYFDEVATVFVRQEGHEALIANARAHFAEWSSKTIASLSTPLPQWQWPIERATALDSYAALLATLGAGAAAMQFYSRELDLALTASQEARVRYTLALYLARSGNRKAAREQLDKAAARDPTNLGVRRLRARLGD